MNNNYSLFGLDWTKIVYILPCDFQKKKITKIKPSIQKDLENSLFTSDKRFKNSKQSEHLSYNINILNNLAVDSKDFLYINEKINIQLTENNVESWLKMLILESQEVKYDFDDDIFE